MQRVQSCAALCEVFIKTAPTPTPPTLQNFLYPEVKRLLEIFQCSYQRPSLLKQLSEFLPISEWVW